jgi:hypothetical protein
MHCLKATILLALFFLASNIQAQEIDKTYRELKYISEYHLLLNNDSIEPFYISKNPITNREYLTYLCWIADVYSYYPENLLYAFPELDKNTIDSSLNRGFTPIQIRTLVDNNDFVRHYMFCSKYLDYPVLGLTWNQSMNFLYWLSDRYNEYLLIRKGIQNLNLDQCCRDSFNTEAYLMGEYVGIISHEILDSETYEPRGVKWKDRILVPSFRLPSKNEITTVGQRLNISLKDYEPNKFLQPWINYYLEINKNEIILRIEDGNFLVFSYWKNVIMRPEYHEMLGEISELTLDQSFIIKENSILKIFSNLNQNIIEINNSDSIVLSDSLGHMPFILISEDKYSNPIFIERINCFSEYYDERNPVKKYSTFRYALSGIKK